MPDVAAAHAYAGENARADEVLPGSAAHRLDDLAGHEVEHVVIGVRASKARRGPVVPKSPRDLLPIVGGRGPPEQIAGAEPEAAPVDEQIPDRDLARDEGIPHLERR